MDDDDDQLSSDDGGEQPLNLVSFSSQEIPLHHIAYV